MTNNCRAIFLIVLLIPLLLLSQESNVEIIIKPSNTFIKLNNEVIDLSKTNGQHITYLSPGVYYIEIWSPNKTTLKDSLIVVEGEITRFLKVTNKYNDAYLDYLREQKKYKLSKLGNTTLDITLGLANVGLITYVATPVNKKLTNNFRQAEMNYDNAVASNEIITTKNLYENLQKQYNRRSTLKYALGVPLLATSVGTSIYYYIHRAKNKRNPPEEYKDTNPFLSNNMQLDMMNLGNSSGFTLSFKTKF